MYFTYVGEWYGTNGTGFSEERVLSDIKYAEMNPLEFDNANDLIEDGYELLAECYGLSREEAQTKIKALSYAEV